MIPGSSRQRITRSSSRAPCPVCGGSGCGQVGSLALCWRVESDRQAKGGAWIHGRMIEAEKQFIRRADPPIAPIERRHAVFGALLDRLALAGAHADHLAETRGLSDATIVAEGFASVPDGKAAARLVAELAAEFDLAHVPGFWRKEKEWRLRFAGVAGFYIPIRDPLGRIEALQIRCDTNEKAKRYLLVSTPPDEFPQGASSGAPAHFAHPDQQETVVITEGALKAMICADHLQACVIGLVAAGCFRSSIGWRLRRDLPGARRIGIAFDSDWRSNAKVAEQRQRLIEALSVAGYAPTTLTWPGAYKGLDDYLIGGTGA